MTRRLHQADESDAVALNRTPMADSKSADWVQVLGLQWMRRGIPIAFTRNCRADVGAGNRLEREFEGASARAGVRFESALGHSFRSATIGSTRAARRAGSQHASAAVAASTAAAA